MRVYYAHPVSEYNTLQESLNIAAIEQIFPGCKLVNPNQPYHEAQYQSFGMEYFEGLVRSCDMVVASPFPDGEYGMGVWREMEVAANWQRPVRVLVTEKGTIEAQRINYQDIRPLSITETKRRVIESKLFGQK